MRFLGVLLLPLLGGCSAAAPSHDVVARLPSPDGVIDALVIESNGGATTSFWYDVCLVPHGGTCHVTDSISTIYGAVRNNEAYGVNARWATNSLLQIEYLEARRAVPAKTVANVSDRTVDVELRPGTLDPSAPPGGMLFNLQSEPQDAP